MPTYVYQREDGSQFEISQKITEDALEVCPDTGQKVKRLISGGNFILKGGGWYKDGYGSGSSDNSDSSSNGSASSNSASSTSASSSSTESSSPESNSSNSGSGSSGSSEKKATSCAGSPAKCGCSH